MPEAIVPEEAVDLYLSDREAEVTESTYRNHKYHLQRFLEWCEQVDFDDMSEMTRARLKNKHGREREVTSIRHSVRC